MSGPFTDDEKELIASALHEKRARYELLKGPARYLPGSTKASKQSTDDWIRRFGIRITQIIEKL